MFAQAYQSGFISLLSSVGSKPLQLWEKRSQSHAIDRVLDDAVQSAVIEIGLGTASADASDADDALVHTWLRCPAPRVAASLHIRLPQLIFQLRPLPQRHCSIEVHVQDHTQTRRRLRMSTFQRATVVHELIAVLPLQLQGESEWNQLQLDLPALVRGAYGTRYEHTVSVRVHAHCRVRRVFFAEQMPAEDALPIEFRLFRRLSKQQIAQLKAADEDQQDEELR